MYTKITYYHTLYKRNVTDIACGPIQFHHTDRTFITFKSAGHGVMVDAKYIKSIEPLED